MAANSDQGVANCPCIERKAMAKVKRVGVSRNVQAKMNSVHPVMKLNRIVTAKAGTERGKITLKNVRVTLAPAWLLQAASTK